MRLGGARASIHIRERVPFVSTLVGAARRRHTGAARPLRARATGRHARRARHPSPGAVDARAARSSSRRARAPQHARAIVIDLGGSSRVADRADTLPRGARRPPAELRGRLAFRTSGRRSPPYAATCGMLPNAALLERRRSRATARATAPPITIARARRASFALVLERDHALRVRAREQRTASLASRSLRTARRAHEESARASRCGPAARRVAPRVPVGDVAAGPRSRRRCRSPRAPRAPR
jgi:hypothetical protein